MTYDLRRLRVHGLIERVPHTNTYTVTHEGIRVAVFYTKVHSRLLRPLIAASDEPPAPPELRRALSTIDRIIADLRRQRTTTPSRVKLAEKLKLPTPQQS
jgi:predicted MarR family transcription regulator